MFICHAAADADGNAADFEIMTDIISEIEDCLYLFPNHFIICGGDFNTDLNTASKASNFLQQFVFKFDLEVGMPKFDSSNEPAHTYCHESLNHVSCINFCLYSNQLKNNVQGYKILELDINLSDHNPVTMKVLDLLHFEPKSVNITDNLVQNNTGKSCKYVLKWDHSNLSVYYDLTFQGFMLTLEKLRYLENECKDDSSFEGSAKLETEINVIYKEITQKLKDAADQCIIRKPCNFYKY